MKLKALVGVVAGTAISLATGVLGAAPAQAAARDGICESGEFCYYYNSGPAGSVSDFTASVSNYGTDPATCYVFKGAGAGQGQCIKNNAAAVWNRSSQTVRIYYNSGYTGTYLDIPAGQQRNLSGTALYNENASHQFIGGQTTPPSSGDSSRGGAISRTEIIQRAQYWVDHQPGAYNRYGYAAGPAPDTFLYRRDCSGYVSMAWHLADNAWTGSLYDTYSTALPSKRSLLPGDILDNRANHVILFDKWIDSNTFMYYSFGKTPVRHLTANITSASIDGWATSSYSPRRYTKVTG